MSKKIMIVAGEASGDQRGAEVVTALKKIEPDLNIFGIGGTDMREAGVNTLIDINELAVMGFVEVIKHLPHLVQVMKRTKALLLQERPDLLILVDYPGFNLRLAEFAKKNGIKVLFYISPQVWAWRQGRVKRIAQVVDHMAVIFPFEKKFYEDYDVPVTYVGHPLTEKIKTALSHTEAVNKLSLTPYNPVITLCPGSRYSEVTSLLPIMLAAAKDILKSEPTAQFVVARASTIDAKLIEDLIHQSGVANVKCSADSLLAMSAANVIMTASGTATLEAALLNKPMVIAYKVSKMTAFLARRLIKIPHISLANIIAGEHVATELLQDQANAENMALEVLNLIEQPELYQATVEKLQQINRKLGYSQAADNVAKVAFELIDCNK